MSKKNDYAAGFCWRPADRNGRWTDWKRDLLVSLVLAIAIGLVGMAAAARADARLVQIGGKTRTAMLTVVMGKSQDVRTDRSFVDVTVGDPEIADVNPLTDHSLSILAKKIGTTRVSVYAEDKKLVGIFDVEVNYDLSRLTNELRRRFPGSTLSASSVNGRIMLAGEVPDSVSMEKAVTIARQFGPEVINSVAVMQPQQVMLEVRFLELNRTAGRELGVQWNRVGSSSITNIGNRESRINLPNTESGLPLGAVPGIAAGVLSGGAPFGFMIARMVAGGVSTDMMINALEQKGIARSLAEPNLVALSGDTASFLAGGEYPIPVAGTLGNVTVTYKKYGVGLAFTPTVLSRGVINLKIEPEVSQIDTQHNVDLGNSVSVPALIVRRASTTVELRDGQSFMIGGLLQTVNQNDVEQLPWLGSVPVLGTLFSSKSYQQKQTDLAIIVTPHLVRPARPGDGLRSPLDDTVPPNDVDFFLLGKTEKPRENRAIAVAGGRIAAAGGLPFTGHILTLETGVPDAAIR